SVADQKTSHRFALITQIRKARSSSLLLIRSVSFRANLWLILLLSDVSCGLLQRTLTRPATIQPILTLSAEGAAGTLLAKCCSDVRNFIKSFVRAEPLSKRSTWLVTK